MAVTRGGNMDELARLPAVLHASFQRYAASAGDNDATAGLLLESDVDEWVLCLRSAFYSPQTAAKRDASISKFQQLERALVDALEAIPGRDGALFPDFVVRFVVALSREPVADPSAQESPPAAQSDQPIVSPASAGASSEPTCKRPAKAARVRTQPNAPIAFVVVGALKKLVAAPGNERFRDACHRQSRENAVLRAFCERELDAVTRTVDTKLLVEVLDLFDCDFVEDEAIRALATNLLDTKQHSSVVRLLETFQSRLEWNFVDIMRTMIQSKDWGSAELVAKTFETDTDRQVLAKTLVEEAINLHDFKRAHRIVYNFGIQQEFPDIELLYSRDALLKLIEKQKWTLAMSYVGSDATLQAVLLSHLVAAREWRLATSLARDRMGMADFDPEKQALAMEELVKNGHSSPLASLPVHGYLELTLKDDDIVFCDTEESVRLAASHFFSDNSPTRSLVGLDVEWRPTSTKIASHTGSLTTTAVASILQIASATKVFIIDLLALHELEYLFDGFLLRLFSSESILKIGFGFDSDLKVLHQTFPERAAFRNVSPFVELSSIVQKVLGATVGNSLSNATALILGKPLDKRMQLSNCDERPLSHSQVVYAALDASCLVQICDYIQQNGLVDDKSAVTNWETILSGMTGSVGLTSPIGDAESITTAVEYRKKYQVAWEQKLHHHGVIDSKDLICTTEVQAFWEKRAELESLPHQPDTVLTLLPVQDLEPLLAVVEEQPTAYVAVNSICFFADEKPCVACIDSASKLDTSRLATLCGLSRRKIKLATAMECETIWGFSPGTVPPFGHRISSDHPEVPIFVDIMVKEYEKWVTGSGSHDQLLVFSSRAFFRLITVKATSDIALQRNGTNRQLHHGDSQDPVDGSQAEGIPPISSGGASLEYKFLADTMVGRVGRWLRTIGIDVLIWGKKEELPLGVDELGAFPDRQSALIAIAAREQRIILTRDKKMADRRDAGACFVVSSDDPHQQFQEIKTHFALELRREDMMTRCAVCNFKGFETIDRAYVKQHMPDAVNANVLELVDAYWKCLACHKLYWVGPKYSSAYENMLAKFEGSMDL